MAEGDNVIPFATVLGMLGYFEENANAGPDRRINQVWIQQLFQDGSGYLYVELSSTQEDHVGEVHLMATLFPVTRRIHFTNMSELLDILGNMDSIPLPCHPEM